MPTRRSSTWLRQHPEGSVDSRVKPEERLLIVLDVIELMEPRPAHRSGPRTATPVDTGMVVIDPGHPLHGLTSSSVAPARQGVDAASCACLQVEPRAARSAAPRAIRSRGCPGSASDLIGRVCAGATSDYPVLGYAL
jgi:hypothetical protein